jgi:hypothetical protein
VHHIETVALRRFVASSRAESRRQAPWRSDRRPALPFDAQGLYVPFSRGGGHACLGGRGGFRSSFFFQIFQREVAYEARADAIAAGALEPPPLGTLISF